MKIWAITVSVLLAGAVGAGAFFGLTLSSDLTTARADIETLEGEKATLEGDVVSLEGTVSTLETDVAELETIKANLESDLSDASDTIQSQFDEIYSLERDLAAAESSASAWLSQYNSTRAELSVLEQKVDGCSPYGEILEKYYFIPSDYFTFFEIVDMTSMVDDTGDATLIELWDTWLDYNTPGNAYAFWVAVWDGLWETLCGDGSSV